MKTSFYYFESYNDVTCVGFTSHDHILGKSIILRCLENCVTWNQILGSGSTCYGQFTIMQQFPWLYPSWLSIFFQFLWASVLSLFTSWVLHILW